MTIQGCDLQAKQQTIAMGSAPLNYPLSPNNSRAAMGQPADDDRVHVDGGGDNRGVQTKRQGLLNHTGEHCCTFNCGERERASSGVESQ